MKFIGKSAPVVYIASVSFICVSLASFATAADSCPANDGPSDKQLVTTIGIVGKEVAARKIVPDYKYNPAVWGTAQSYHAPSSYSEMSPGSYYSQRSALWGLFGKTTYYVPGTVSTYSSGGYYDDVSVLIKPENFEKIRSYLTQLPHTTSDLKLLQANLVEKDFTENAHRTVDLVKSADTAQMLKRLATDVIEHNGNDLDDEDREKLRAQELAYLSRAKQKEWEYQFSDEVVYRSGSPSFERSFHIRLQSEVYQAIHDWSASDNGITSREAFFSLLLSRADFAATDDFRPINRNLEWKHDKSRSKLIPLLIEASKRDPRADYWKAVDSLIKDSNYAQFLFDSSSTLTWHIEDKRVNSLGGLLKTLNPSRVIPKKGCVAAVVPTADPGAEDFMIAGHFLRPMDAYAVPERDKSVDSDRQQKVTAAPPGAGESLGAQKQKNTGAVDIR